MIIEIDDEFDPEKIAFSGQCFRAKKVGDRFRFITKDKYIDIKYDSKNKWNVSCTKREWQDVWYNYFDLMKNYSSIRKRFRGINEFLDNAINSSQGLRILNQDKFETLISFIISQRKSIPAISKSIEDLCSKYGEKDSKESIYFFPYPQKLALSHPLECSLGYRDEYVRCASRLINDNKISLEKLSSLGDEELLSSLMKIKGVGIKVASCTALFAYSRGSIAPKDVWINRIIDTHFNSISPFENFGIYAGLIQQYMFYYQRTLNKSFSNELRQD